MTGAPAIVIFRQYREARRDTKDIQLVARLLDEGFGATRLGRRQKNSIWSAGNIFFCPEHANIGLNLVVIGSDIFVSDGPVIAHAVGGAGFEIAGSET